MHQISDSDTADSDDGIRFKTATTRDAPRSRNAPPNSQAKCGRSQSGDAAEKVRRDSCSTSPQCRTRSRACKSRRRSGRSRSRSPTRRGETSRSSRGVSGRPRSQSGERCSRVKPSASKAAVENAFTEHVANDEICGPALPPSVRNSEQVAFGPLLPRKVPNVVHTAASPMVERNETVCGPALPPHRSRTSRQSAAQCDDVAVCGPALPPHLRKSNACTTPEVAEERRTVVGPFIPEHMRRQLAEQDSQTASCEQAACAAEGDETAGDGDDDCYGPLPLGMQPRSRAHTALEERALQLKLDQLAPQAPDAAVREEWMLQLPTVHAANLGLGARQFRAKGGPDLSDRSSWTDTPDGSSKKAARAEHGVALKEEAERIAMRTRDEEQEAMAKQARKAHKRGKSLMEQHQERLRAKKKVENEQGPTVRRPFDRETDLNVNRFDDAQRNAVMKKARLLDDRFAHGQTKFM